VGTNLSKQHTISVFTVKSHLNISQHTARMQMPQYKFAPLLTLQCYTHNTPYQKPLLLVMLLTNDPPPPGFVRPSLLLYHGPHFNQQKQLDMSHCTQMVLFPLNPCCSVNHRTLRSESCALFIHNKHTKITTFCKSRTSLVLENHTLGDRLFAELQLSKWNDIICFLLFVFSHSIYSLSQQHILVT